MKKFQYKIILPLSLSALVILYACSKSFLEINPLGNLQQENLANAKGVNALLIGAYSALDGYGVAGGDYGTGVSNWVYGGVASDDAYKGSDPGDQPAIVPIETYTADPSNYYFENKWKAVYDGVQRCNDVLRMLPLATDLADADKARITAEARFLRAHFHFEAKKMWNKVPYIDETVSYGQGNFYVSNTEDIWPKIEADFQYAVDNLPATQSQVGRANSWAAKAYLAKAYMFEHKYEQAKPLLQDVIEHGVTASGIKYDLNANFFDNFNAATKNNQEDVFSLQQSVNDGAQGANGNYGDVLNFPYGGGPGGCCGFYQPSQSLVNSYRVDGSGLPFLDTWNDVDVKNDMGIASNQPFTPETAPLDPRLDLTVGRRGIPYLDWGNHPGASWIRDQNNGGPYSPKKNVYFKSQEGSLTDASFWTKGVTANNYVFIRFSDVLLWAAECEVEASGGSLDRAKDYVNRVRSRMKDHPEAWVHKYVDDNDPSRGFSSELAANYSIGLYSSFPNPDYARKAIRFERKLELAMEGHRFFDLQRYDNGTGYMADVLNAYIQKEKSQHTYLQGKTFVKGKNEYFPIPQTEIDLSRGALHQNPNY
jgi:hypothetical protein